MFNSKFINRQDVDLGLTTRCIMNEKQSKSEEKNLPIGVDCPDDRCGYDRRKVMSEGYTYVSCVGWICRREHNRRSIDDEER